MCSSFTARVISSSLSPAHSISALSYTITLLFTLTCAFILFLLTPILDFFANKCLCFCAFFPLSLRYFALLPFYMQQLCKDFGTMNDDVTHLVLSSVIYCFCGMCRFRNLLHIHKLYKLMSRSKSGF